MDIEKILEIIANYHNEDPEAWQDLPKATRAKEMVLFIIGETRGLEKDSYDVGALLENILQELTDKDFKQIQEMLTIR